MPAKECVIEHHGYTIRVINTWLGGAKLYIDGDCKDICHDLSVPRKRLILNGTVDVNGEKRKVEVYCKAPFFTVRMMICIDGQQVGGDTI